MAMIQNLFSIFLHNPVKCKSVAKTAIECVRQLLILKTACVYPVKKFKYQNLNLENLMDFYLHKVTSNFVFINANG